MRRAARKIPAALSFAFATVFNVAAAFTYDGNLTVATVSAVVFTAVPFGGGLPSLCRFCGHDGGVFASFGHFAYPVILFCPAKAGAWPPRSKAETAAKMKQKRYEANRKPSQNEV